MTETTTKQYNIKKGKYNIVDAYLKQKLHLHIYKDKENYFSIVKTKKKYTVDMNLQMKIKQAHKQY
jgi:hypothetical protein